MNLPVLFDVGNTAVKVLDTSTEELMVCSHSAFSDFLDAHPEKSLFGYASGNKTLFEGRENPIHLLSVNDKWPLKSQYESMNTLGMDRWALCNAYFLEGNQSFLLVTMGTCITYNVVVDGVFLGGAISPGWDMRFSAMHTMTAALPKVEFSEASSLLGRTTQQSLRAGVDVAIQKELEGMIEGYTERFQLNTVLICGGHAKRLPNPLKNYIFAPVNYEIHALRQLYQYHFKEGLV